MANEIKQIKVGDITYNIEPYTSYLPLAGGHMSGDIKMTENSTSIIFRSASADWYSGIYANSSGDEVLGIVVSNPRTHIMLGTADVSERPACTALTPAIDIKNGKVGINKRLGTDGQADAGSYELDVNGTISANSVVLDTSGSLTTNKIIHSGEEADLEIGDPENAAYVKFVEDVQIGDLSIDLEGNIGGIEKISIGKNASALTTGSIAVGVSASSYSENSIAIGGSAKATGTRAVAIGYDTKVSGSYSVGVGGSNIVGTYNTALGYSTSATGTNSTVIGYNEDSYGNYNTAIGAGTTVTGTGNVIAGYSNGTSGSYNVVLGYSTHGSSSSYGIAVGYGAYSYNNYNIAIGSSARAGNHSTTAADIKTGQIAIGASANVTAGACGSIVIGEAAYVATNSNLQGQQLVIGRKSYAHSANTGDGSWNYNTGQIVIGHCTKATNGDGCIVIGNGKYNNTSSYYPYASGLNCIVIGSADAWSADIVNGARAYGLNCIAIGMGSVATGSGNIAIGRQAVATSTSSIAIGPSAKARGAYAIAIGTSVTATASGTKGYVYIGNSTSNYRYYGGTATTWSSGSDIRDKTDIEPLTGGVDLIKAIQPIIYRENPRDVYSETGSLFDYDKDEHAKATKAGFKYLASFKAQEVAKYMEDNYGDESFNNIIDHERWYDDVNDENIDRYFMAYGDLVPFMFQAIKEQQEVIEEQEERINTLENKLNELLKRVD